MNQFKKYQHLERLYKKEVSGIDQGTCYIFSKLDGTNSQIWLENGELKAGSRNNILTLEKDNYGFYQYVLNNKDLYLPFFTILPNAILYGEFLKIHNIKTYRKDALDKFYVFDVMLNDHYIEYDTYQLTLEKLGILYVPLLAKVNDYKGDFSEFLPQADFLLESGHGEGIVIKNYDFVNKYGETKWAKLINENFSLEKGKPRPVRNEADNTLEQKIVDELVTEHFVKKEYTKLIAQLGEGVKGIQGQLLRVVNKTLIDEEGSFIVEQYGENVDFKLITKFTTLKVKQVLPELF
ncbi:MAG TPA: RNA ligase family protein [Taishania sp.]|nr:RNA ligase family protein [Taishania sp.]